MPAVMRLHLVSQKTALLPHSFTEKVLLAQFQMLNGLTELQQIILLLHIPINSLTRAPNTDLKDCIELPKGLPQLLSGRSQADSAASPEFPDQQQTQPTELTSHAGEPPVLSSDN
jgi:hypothetical protein